MAPGKWLARNTPVLCHLQLFPAPTIKVECWLTSDTYRRSLDHEPFEQNPRLIAKTTLLSPPMATFELIGEWDTQNVLHDSFRAQHFSFVDLATGKEVVNKDPFPGTCDPHNPLGKYVMLEIYASKPRETVLYLSDIDPGSDPVRQLEIGHEYAVKLIPQRIKCYQRSIQQIFGDRDSVPVEELPEAFEVVLECDTEMRLKVEE
ncbi:hypothetical protein Slin15195_G063820 [Septoria linicola]|uniref:Uncharacterized protein n=1 Tax=Septoria linicola TaxID=215465 RepID=A0A9Q9ATT8_9PEZI|nr:hypothetical protein Slin15195_G063820 [Septoria linicola]